MRKINKKTICIILLIGIIILSNLVWGYIYIREKNNLRRSLIPIAKGDYYQARLALVDNFENSKEYEYKENIWVIDDIKTDVPFISQLPDYPNGCEAVSAVMLLKKYGVDIIIDEFVSKYLKKDNIYSVDGERYGPNPKDTYAGDPSSLTGGFGVFSVGIKDAIDKVLDEKMNNNSKYKTFLYAYDTSDTAWTLDCYTSVFPVIIWATTNYEPVSEMWTWKSYDGRHTYTYPKNSHTIVVTGVDKEYYYVNDPLQSEGNTKVKKKDLEKSFDSLGRQVVGIQKFGDYVEKETNE